MTNLTKTQRKTLQKKLPKVLAKCMRLAITLATSKVGIGRDFAEKEHICFAGYLAAFCDMYAQSYNEESGGKFASNLYVRLRKELYDDEEFINPFSNLTEYMRIEEFALGFYAGFHDVMPLIEKNEIFSGGLVAAIKKL